MKTKILLLFLFFPLCLLYSQIVYDFSSGYFENKKLTVRRGEPVSLKIKNINPFFYEIVIKREDKEIAFQNTDIEAAKKTLDEIQQNNYYKIQENFVFDESYVNLSQLTQKPEDNARVQSLQSKNYELDSLELLIQKLINEKKDIEEKIKAIDLPVDASDKVVLNDYQIKKKNTEDSIYDNQQKLLKLKSEKQQIESQSNDINLLKVNINKRVEDLNKIYIEYIKVSRDIIKYNQNYNNYIDKVISPELTCEMYESILKNGKNNALYKKCRDGNNDSECTRLLNSVLPPEIETTFFLNKENLDYAYGVFKYYPNVYQDLIEKVNDFISYLNYGTLNSTNEGGTLKSMVARELERIQKSIKNVDDVIQKINLSKKLNEVEILDRLLRKPETFEYVSAPIQGEEDYLEFDVVIKSKRNLSNTYHINNDKSFKYFKYITGGIRFDFSVGTVFDFGTIDKKYTLDSESKIQRLDNNKYNPTIAGIFHASFRNSKSVAFGFSLGASFTTGLSFNSIFPGVSLLMGKRNKIILTAGPSFRLVDELKSNYKEGMTLNNSLADSDLLTKNFRIGGFFGISYNLTPKQKDVLKLK
ncbi:hypothetical protein SAMN05421786_102339 [Chryseobacterium ureilyticum]|uniref:Uncharacterized protein n=1 Tax=Chryseobacterium ureilyticum TaxID=373668 RepID=A0A1N7M7L2_9FLAO|nr:hypothetical protein [Chryseobacterium ureilyticum]SIS82013.1 hypothetical protein SAMN05421786_102339 [Chryseobacterium ureilyticum]